MTASETSVDVLARILAIGGFTINALGFLYLILQGRRRISVKAYNTHRFHAGEDVGGMLDITIVNTGHRAVTIGGVRFDFSDKNYLISSKVHEDDRDGHYRMINCIYRPIALPKRIEDGESVSLYFDFEHIGNYMIERGSNIDLLNIYVFDIKSKKYKAKVPKGVFKIINRLTNNRDDDSS